MNPEDFDPGTLAEVRHVPQGERSTLVFVRHIRHAPAKVWAALTDPDQLSRWSPFVPDRNLAESKEATLRMTDGQTVEEFPSQIREATPPRVLEYTWGDDVIRWELRPDGRGTKLTLRHTTDAPKWAPRAAAGWHLCLVVAERWLDGEPIGPIVGREAKKYGWDALHDAYAAELDIESEGWPD